MISGFHFFSKFTFYRNLRKKVKSCVHISRLFLATKLVCSLVTYLLPDKCPNVTRRFSVCDCSEAAAAAAVLSRALSAQLIGRGASHREYRYCYYQVAVTRSRRIPRGPRQSGLNRGSIGVACKQAPFYHPASEPKQKSRVSSFSVVGGRAPMQSRPPATKHSPPLLPETPYEKKPLRQNAAKKKPLV